MCYFEFIDRLKRVDNLIHAENTGNSEAFAKKIGISRRSVFDYLKALKEKGAAIEFSKTRKTFYYKEKFKLNF